MTRGMRRPGRRIARPARAVRGRPHRTSVWRLPPWTRAPWLGLRSPAAVVAVLVTTAILACAGASAPLFLSSARSAALQQELAPQCAEAGWPTTGAFAAPYAGTTPAQLTAYADRFPAAWSAQGHPSDQVLAIEESVGRSGRPAARHPGRRPDRQPAVADPRRCSGGPTRCPTCGWCRGPTRPACGCPRRTRRPRTPAWVTRSRWPGRGCRSPASTPTCSTPTTAATGAPTRASSSTPHRRTPRRLRWSSPPTGGPWSPLAAAARFLTIAQQVRVEARDLSASDAQHLLAQQDRAEQAAVAPDDPVRPESNGALRAAVDQATTIERGLQGPVVPVAVAGALLALVLVASAGSFWADRRAAEVRLLAARGVGPVPLAGKAALELGLPALAGAALGWAASRLLTAALGPADDLDPSATSAALLAGGAAFVVGLLCAAVVAGLRARGTAERPLGAAPRWPSRVPWELLLLGAAAACWAVLEAPGADHRPRGGPGQRAARGLPAAGPRRRGGAAGPAALPDGCPGCAGGPRAGARPSSSRSTGWSPPGWPPRPCWWRSPCRSPSWGTPRR